MQQPSTASKFNLMPSFGTLLKQWRNQRGLSQLDLALSSEVSQRHISFLESGRAKPSRDMVLQLATVLEIPLRQQNLLLTAAEFAPIHAETDLSAPEMTSIRKALDFMLCKQEPYPGFIIDRYWNLLLTNNAATRLLHTFIDSDKLQNLFCIDGKINLMRLMFHPQGIRPFVVNWQELAGHLLQRVQREAITQAGALVRTAPKAIADGHSQQSTSLLDELISYPGISEVWQISKPAQQALLLTVHFKYNDLNWQFFSTIATLGTSYDITLQELRIECLFPADEATEQNWQQKYEDCQNYPKTPAITLPQV